jgi:phenylacetate-coenzyme A ligase PaaK-like adenylate-forming protein
LDRFAQPCICFYAKDIIERDSATSDCGRTLRLIKGGVIGRADDITKVKGVLLAPSAIADVVRIQASVKMLELNVSNSSNIIEHCVWTALSVNRW